MQRKGTKLFGMLLIAILFLLSDTKTADGYVGSVFTYTYEGQTITYVVTSEPTVTENGTAKLIYANGANKNLTGKVSIPATVTNQKMSYNVVGIDPSVFMDAKNITSITLPDTITSIGEDAFRNCAGLASIYIPSSVKRIEPGTFAGCSSLKDINLPAGLSYIGDDAFTGCSSLVLINLPESLTYLGNSVFAGCSRLTEIYLPEDLKDLGTAVFSGCSSLLEVNIPEGITGIEDEMFQDCTSLTTVSLPEGITYLGDRAFYNCTSLTGLHLPEAIKSIGAYAFYQCKSLTSIKIPYGVTVIEKYTFYGCSGMTSVTIEGKLANIRNYAFSNCSSLITIALPQELIGIGDGAFTGCESLRPITIPTGVNSIGFGDLPYCGVQVYKNSYAYTFYQKYYPQYCQVINLPLEEMSFEEEVMNIGVENTAQLKLVLYPKYSSDITDEITWQSLDPSVASVDANGAIQGLTAGETYITAYMGKYSATCRIIVGGEATNPSALSFTKSSIDLVKGASAKLKLNFTPSNTTNRKITWTSSDSSVATVENGCIYAKGTGTAVITARSGATWTQCNITVTSPLKGIYTDYGSITLNKGDSKKVSISYNPMDTTDARTIVWKSGNEAVATVKNGVITAVSSGSTKITATVGAFSCNIPVTVQIAVESLSLTPTKLSLTAGQSQALSLVVLPENATENLRITSSDESVAIYSEGRITALKRGEATITVKSGAYSASCRVTVDTDIKSIKLNKTSLTLYMGGSDTLSATFNPAVVADDKTIIWVSSDEAVVSVDSNGKLKPNGTGTATITATAGGNKTATCKVNVKLSVPASFKVASAGYNSIKISWGKVSGAERYRVYRATSLSGTYERIADIKTNSFTDTGLTAGKTYYYKVRCYCYQGSQKVYSSYTAKLSVKPVPPVPDNVKLVKLSSNMINFTWNQVKGASGYEIYRYSNVTTTPQLVKTTTSLHYMNYGLTKGRTYYYKVRAYRLVGKQKVYSGFSAVFSMKI
jgi:uncharacterized protein YjdB